jgi:hypothetical protein
MINRKKTIKKYDKLLKSYIGNKDFIRVEREFEEGELDVSGFLLNISKNFILMQKEEDFRLDGYYIIPKHRFDSIRNNKFDKTHKKILNKEGMTEKDYGIDIEIDLTDWNTVFQSLKKNDRHVIVECEDMEEPMFLIGPIKRINKKSVSIQYYDATGLLDKKPTTVKFDDITIIRFDERYLNIFRKYLRTRKKKKK